jgi:predicted nucleic acid-binding protein
VTVLDTSAAVDYLLGVGASAQVQRLMSEEGELAAPDLLVFEVLAVLRRACHRGVVGDARAAGAVSDLGELSIRLFPSMPLRGRAWALRAKLTAGDALFVALAESLDEPLATKDEALASEAAKHASLEVVRLSGASSPGSAGASPRQDEQHS